jgi:hypothetical protein
MAFKILNKKPEVDPMIEQIKQSIPDLEPEELPTFNPKLKKELYQVVDKIPVQEVRLYKREDGVIVNFITKEEAAEMINAGTI